MAGDRLRLLVKSVTYETADTRVYDLRSPDGNELPSFTAGAHIDLHLGNGLIRSYSILSSQDDRTRYRIGVARDRKSRGGSTHIHDTFQVGDLVELSAPRNNFPVDEGEHDSVLIAGGIGVTPMISMLQRLESLGRNWTLYVASRSASALPFREELTRPSGAVRFHYDDEHDGAVLDIAALVAASKPGAHFYCCGPTPMLDAFKKAVRDIPEHAVHFEHFAAVEAAATEGGFDVELARSNKLVHVLEGQTILDALRDCGVDVPFSCQAGVCGSCETKILAGVPDHRDLILTDKERSSNRSMMICCSGSKSQKLVLDL